MSMIDPKMEIVLTAKDMTAKAFREVEGHATRLRKQVFSLNGAITTLAGATGMGYLASQSLAMTAEMKKNAEMAGVSAKAYQELTFAAGKYQVTQDALTDGMKELSLRTDEFVVTGAGPAKEAFERLGYSQGELNKKMKDTPALLLDIIDRMQGLGQAAKIRIADELFGGTGGEQFVAMVNAGSASIEELTEKANGLGLVMSDKTAAGALEAHNSIKTLTSQLQTQFNEVVAGLAPDIEELAEKMGEWVSENKTFLTQDIPGHIRDTGGAIKDIATSPWFKTFMENWEVLVGMRVGAAFGPYGFVIGGLLGKLADLYGRMKEVEEASGQVLHSIDEGTEGFKRYSEGAGGAAGSTDNLGDTLKTNEQINREYAESLKEIEIGWMNLDALNMTDKERRMLIDEDDYNAAKAWLDKWEQDRQDQIDAGIDAEEKAQKEIDRLNEKARKEYEREWERVYDDMHKFAADAFYDIFDGQLNSFEDFAGSMLDIFKRMLANMAAEAAMTNIFKPIMHSLAGSSIGNLLGLPGSSGGNIGSLLGIGGTGNFSNSLGILGEATGLWGGGLANGTSTYSLASGVGAGQVGGVGAGSISSIISSAMATAIPVAVMAGGAKILSEVASGWGERTPRAFFYGAEGEQPERVVGGERGENLRYHTPQYTQLASEMFDYSVAVKYAGDDAGLREKFVEYFDTVFGGVQEIMPKAIETALALQPDMFEDAFGARRGTGSGVSLQQLSEDVFSQFFDSLITQLLPEGSASFDEAFFKSMIPEGGTIWDSFISFANTVDVNEGFLEDFNRRIVELGQSSKEAYQDIQLVTNILTAIDADLEAITSSTTWQQGLDNLNLAFDEMVYQLKEAEATTKQVAEAEAARNEMQAAYLTGLTGASIEQALTSGGDISAIVAKSMKSMMVSAFASNLMDDALTEFNAQVQEAFEAGGEDAALAVYQAFDFGPVQEKVNDFFSEFGSEVEDFTEALSDSRDALDRAIDKEQQLINARLSAANQIDSLLIDLMGGSLAPVQSMEFFEKRYDQLLSDAQGANTAEEIEKAVSAITGFVPNYLEFAGAYGGGDYVDLYNRIVDDLSSMSEAQKDLAYDQMDELSSIEKILGETQTEVMGIHQALREYLGAAAQAGEGPETLGQVWEAAKILTPLGDVVDTAKKVYEKNPLLQSIGGFLGFSGGAVLDGPASGYQLPTNPTFHGQEAIVPMNNGSIPVQIQGPANMGNVQVRVFVGNRELNDITTEVIRTDPEAQNQIRRVANG